MATQVDVNAFVEASDELSEGTEPLDQGDVVALIGALDAGDDHPEVRWTVLHVIEHQDAAPYLLGTLEALARNPGSEWAGLLVGRLANAPSSGMRWPGCSPPRRRRNGVEESEPFAPWRSSRREHRSEGARTP